MKKRLLKRDTKSVKNKQYRPSIIAPVLIQRLFFVCASLNKTQNWLKPALLASKRLIVFQTQNCHVLLLKELLLPTYCLGVCPTGILVYLQGRCQSGHHSPTGQNKPQTHTHRQTQARQSVQAHILWHFLQNRLAAWKYRHASTHSSAPNLGRRSKDHTAARAKQPKKKPQKPTKNKHTATHSFPTSLREKRC